MHVREKENLGCLNLARPTWVFSRVTSGEHVAWIVVGQPDAVGLSDIQSDPCAGPLYGPQ